MPKDEIFTREELTALQDARKILLRVEKIGRRDIPGQFDLLDSGAVDQIMPLFNAVLTRFENMVSKSKV